MNIINLFKWFFRKNYKYGDILKMDQKKASELFYYKLTTDPFNLYLEMIEHEEKYHSFVYYWKANLKTPSKGESFMQWIFTLEKSEELRLLASEIDERAKLNWEEDPNLLKEAILAKWTQDIIKYCKN